MGRGLRVTLPYIHTFRDRHGKVRRYFRRPGCKRVSLPGVPGSPPFMAAYNAASTAATVIVRDPIGLERSIPGSVSATIAGYYQHASFTVLSDTTQRARRALLERFRSQDGDKRIALLRPEHIGRIIGSKTPFVARDWLKAIRGLMKFAVNVGLRADDPTAAIEMPKVKAGGIHTWSEDEIAIYERHHAVGTRPRLAMAVLLYTAARRSDAIALGRQHIRAGRLSYRQQKTGRALAIPVHPALAAILSETPTGLTFLTTTYGAPYSSVGFGNAFRKWCREAGLRHCSPHGLRKAAARRLAEAGCSAHEIASITGHKTLSEVQRYAEAADQARLAEAAMGRIKNARRQTGHSRIGKP